MPTVKELMRIRVSEKDKAALDKIDYEGGEVMALDYGIKVADFDNPALQEKWEHVMQVYSDLDKEIAAWHELTKDIR